MCTSVIYVSHQIISFINHYMKVTPCSVFSTIHLLYSSRVNQMGMILRLTSQFSEAISFAQKVK